ncbi:MAG: Fpg/Nei family DNA glycosylase [Nitrospirae bacterium]|nr:MAG: Fpg/Nei family DNA glycosylase [Nitrospirota bacterium]
MPELPDVEALRIYLNATSLHQRISNVDVRSPEMLRDVTPAVLCERLCGDQFCETSRHGKHLFVHLERGSWLIMHFGMTGGLAYFKNSRHPIYTRLLITFANGFHLAYLSQRKLGKIGLTVHPRTFVRDHRLGPDALDPKLTPLMLKRLLASRRAPIKLVLMDQHVIAGIGNLYADEILFQSAIAPTTPACQLNEQALYRLERTTKRVLRLAVAKQADPKQFPRSWLFRSRKPGGSCPRCRTHLHTMKLGGRTTFWCPTCQPPSG